MLVNFSNHPQAKWSAEQKAVALDKWGVVKDIPFPNIDPKASAEAVANQALGAVLNFDWMKPHDALLIQGEMGYVAAFLRHFADLMPGVPCIHATTERVVTEDPETGTKTSTFQFTQFRRYLV